MPHIVLIGTCDTKLHELKFLKSKIIQSGGRVSLVDVGRSSVDDEAITISHRTIVTNYAPQEGQQDVSKLARGDVIKYMTLCASNWLREAYEDGIRGRGEAIHGIVSAGGTGGTSLAAGITKAVLPIGFPKLIVSTNASSDISPVVEETDVTMMPSIVDIAGSNELLQTILSNAAGAISGMAHSYEKSLSQRSAARSEGTQAHKKRVGITMFGVTTPCCDKVRDYLEQHYEIECFVFHCTGTGGKAMERIVREGGLDAVCDITTTEICDQIAGGVMDAGPQRLEASLAAGIPYLISVGATDMVNFGPKNTVPKKYTDRKLYEHNPTVTLMRTNEDECTAIGKFIVDKIERRVKDKDRVQVVLPIGGVSMIATPGGPFHNAGADRALFATIKNGLEGSGIAVIEDERAVNDDGFATDIAKRMASLMNL